jgi:fructose-bisphosphate aldolase class II
MRAKTIDILREAKQQGHAVGAFNTSNLEITQGIVQALAEKGHSSIIQVTVSSMDYTGDFVLGQMIGAVIEQDSNGVQVGFHLDHGHSLDEVIRAIDMGVDSVMIDASGKSLHENIAQTKRVVEYAHVRGVAVQAELGAVPYLGKESEVPDWDQIMTDPQEALQLVNETGIDALAVGIGNAHGFFKEREVPDWERLARIRQLLPDIPLIMHGASDWTAEKIKKAIQGGVCCFNIDTDVRLSFLSAICRQTQMKCDITDPRKLLSVAREAVKRKVMEKVKIFQAE